MNRLRAFIESLWQYLPDAGLASEYHPSVEGGAIPIPFIQSQKLLLDSEVPVPQKNAPRLHEPQRSFTCYMQGYSSLPMRDRSLVALRSAHLCNARHLFGDIAECALDTGLLHSDIQMIRRGHMAPGWSRHDTLLLRVTDGLYKDQKISPRYWRELLKIYKPQQILDLVLCIAAFHLCTHPK